VLIGLRRTTTGSWAKTSCASCRSESPAVGIIYDIFNGFSAGKEPGKPPTSGIKAHLIHCHLKDGLRTADGGHRYVYLGEGDLPLARIMAG